MKLNIRDIEAETDKVVESNFLDLLEIQLSLVKKWRINYFNGLDLSI